MLAIILMTGQTSAAVRGSAEWWLTFFTAALVFVTFVLAVVAFLQFLAMRRQESWMQRSVGVAEKSATAAKQNADAIIGSERGWIMVEISRVPAVSGLRMLGDGFDVESESYIQTTSVRFRMTCTNEGRTPAWITERRYCLKILGTTPPAQPELDNADEVQYDPEPLATGKETHRDLTLTVKGQEASGQITILYGIVKYGDVFADNRTTVFGYALTADNRFERLTGLPEYNKNT